MRAVEPLFAAISSCQTLHPDPDEDEDEDEDDLIDEDDSIMHGAMLDPSMLITDASQLTPEQQVPFASPT